MDVSHLGEFGKHPDDDDNDDGDGVHHETSTICYKDSTNESDLWANMSMIVLENFASLTFCFQIFDQHWKFQHVNRKSEEFFASVVFICSRNLIICLHTIKSAKQKLQRPSLSQAEI